MGQHRDDSKSEPQSGRTGNADPGRHSRVSSPGPDDRVGTWGRPEGHGLSPVPPDDAEVPPEEATFSQGGGTGSQPGLAKRMATDESQDEGHLGRNEMHGKTPKGRPNTAARGERNSEPPGGRR
jgi:hypothetical protein